MYKDTMGLKTVCYGFNLDKSGAYQAVSDAGGDFHKLTNGGCATQQVCDRLLNDEV